MEVPEKIAALSVYARLQADISPNLSIDTISI
jgi:hypothetical protein